MVVMAGTTATESARPDRLRARKARRDTRATRLVPAAAACPTHEARLEHVARPSTTAATAADRALELVDTDPARARALALDAIAGRDAAAVSRGERVLGMVAMRQDDYRSALAHLRRAVRVG